MPESATWDLNIVEELQLRRWARENYLAAEHRDRSWHPLILEEMKRRDEELAADNRFGQPFGTSITTGLGRLRLDGPVGDAVPALLALHGIDALEVS